MCEPRARLPVGTAAAALGGAVAVSAAVSWLTGAWPLVLGVTAAVVAVAGAVWWAVCKASQWAARLAVVRWYSRAWAEDPAVLRARYALPVGVSLRAVAAARAPAIEPPRPVVHAVITDAKVRAGVQ